MIMAPTLTVVQTDSSSVQAVQTERASVTPMMEVAQLVAIAPTQAEVEMPVTDVS
jgi:hypothetical protein